MSVSYDFNGKVALITGSNTGIGAAIAILLTKSGAQVVITGRNEQNVNSVANECSYMSPNGSKALAVVADITKEEDLQRLVDTTITTFGKLDILVNNAAINLRTSLTDDYSIDKYRRVLDTNLNSVVYLTHKCVKHLEKTKGIIINISSVRAVQTAKNIFSYCMAKSALDMFTKCMATELGPKGIRVNSLNSGAVRTDIAKTGGLTPEQAKAQYDTCARQYPVGRCGEPIDIANAVLYLASDQASFITGTQLFVDGGHIASNAN